MGGQNKLTAYKNALKLYREMEERSNEGADIRG